MSWQKNGLLLSVGGLAGLALAALLDSAEDEKDREDMEWLEKLADDIRSEAEWAMEECVTDEDREKVYVQVKESVHEYQVNLQEAGESIIEDLRKKAAETMSKEEIEESIENMVQNFKVKTDSFD